MKKTRKSPNRIKKGVNDLWTTHPQLAEKLINKEDGYRITRSNKTMVDWKCEKCDSIFTTCTNRIKDTNNGNGCPYCSSRLVNETNSLKSLNPKLSERWDYQRNGELAPDKVSVNSSKKVWWKCELGHSFESGVHTMNRYNIKCPYCAKFNAKVLKGFNDMWTTNPELANLLADPEDGYKYTKSTNKKLDWKCPNCNTIIKNRNCNNISKQGLRCDKCSDGISFPEKLMRNILTQLNIDYEIQKTFEWSNKKRYDFYIPSLNMIIETHGRQHEYADLGYKGGRSLIEEKENDKYKKSLAIENGIDNYIVILFKNSHIKNSKQYLKDSGLYNFFDIDSLDWDKLSIDSSKSLKVKSLYMWNNGMTFKEISNELKIHITTAREYLKDFYFMGLCDYPIKEDKNNKRCEYGK